MNKNELIIKKQREIIELNNHMWDITPIQNQFEFDNTNEKNFDKSCERIDILEKEIKELDKTICGEKYIVRVVGVVENEPEFREYKFETKEQAIQKFNEINKAYAYGEDYMEFDEETFKDNDTQTFYEYENGDSVDVYWKELKASHRYYENYIILDIDILIKGEK